MSPDCQIGSLILIGNDKRIVKSVPLPCDSWTCPECGPRKAKAIFARAFAGAIGQPLKGFRDKYSTKLLTLTLGGVEFREKYTKAESYKIAKYHFQKLVKNLRHVYGPFEYLAVLELHKDGSLRPATTPYDTPPRPPPGIRCRATTAPILVWITTSSESPRSTP